jgi:hypothetical protein
MFRCRHDIEWVMYDIYPRFYDSFRSLALSRMGLYYTSQFKIVQ